MSTSRPEEWKALGAAVHELVTIIPPELVRFLMLRTDPKRHIDFDPNGTYIPKLYDDYDRAADAFLTEPESDLAKTWSLSQTSEDPEAPEFRVRFSIVADWLQIPSVEPFGHAEDRKGAPLTAAERSDLERRVALAREWLARWAPDRAKFSVLERLPDVTLSDAQRRYLTEVGTLVGTTADGDAMQNELYEAAKRVGLTTPDDKVSQDAFASIYLAFLGKPNGPKAGWLIATLDPAFVRTRLAEAARS
jgi:lysyl-tRNA synthetase class 1